MMIQPGYFAMTLPWWITQTIVDSLSFSQSKAVITLLSYALVGFLILWRTSHTNPVGIAARLIVGFTIVRLSSSYWDYQHGFIEGFWPLLWVGFGLLGAYYGSRLSRPSDHGRTLS